MRCSWRLCHNIGYGVLKLMSARIIFLFNFYLAPKLIPICGFHLHGLDHCHHHHR